MLESSLTMISLNYFKLIKNICDDISGFMISGFHKECIIKNNKIFNGAIIWKS